MAPRSVRPAPRRTHDVDYDFLQSLLATSPRSASTTRSSTCSRSPTSRARVPRRHRHCRTSPDDARRRARARRRRRARSLARAAPTTPRGIPLTIAGQSLSFIRGYDCADVRAGASGCASSTRTSSPQFSDIALAQAQELLAGPAAPSGPPDDRRVRLQLRPALRSAAEPGDTVRRLRAVPAIIGAAASPTSGCSSRPPRAGFTVGADRARERRPARRPPHSTTASTWSSAAAPTARRCRSTTAGSSARTRRAHPATADRPACGRPTTRASWCGCGRSYPPGRPSRIQAPSGSITRYPVGAV